VELEFGLLKDRIVIFLINIKALLTKQEYIDQFYDMLLQLLNSSGGSAGDLSGPRLTLIGTVKVKIDEQMAQSEGTQYNLGNANNSNIIDIYINALLDECAKHILQTAPLHVIEPADGGELTPVSFGGVQGTTAIYPTGYVDLPDDYLRMVSFKMTSWAQEITRPYLITDKIYKHQKYVAVRGGTAKPKVFLNSIIKTNTPAKKIITVTLSGSAGSANVYCAGITRLATFNTSTTQTATDFVTSWAADFLTQGVVLTSSDEDLIFTANVAGVDFNNAYILTVVTDLTGTVVITQANVPARQGVRTLEYYAIDPDVAHAISKFLYIANVGAEYIQSDLTDALTWLCASKVLQIWGQFSGNTAYSQKALEQVDLSYKNLM